MNHKTCSICVNVHSILVISLDEVNDEKQTKKKKIIKKMNQKEIEGETVPESHVTRSRESPCESQDSESH